MNNASEEADSPSRNSLISTVISNYIWSHNQEFLPGFSYRRLESKKRASIINLESNACDCRSINPHRAKLNEPVFHPLFTIIFYEDHRSTRNTTQIDPSPKRHEYPGTIPKNEKNR